MAERATVDAAISKPSAAALKTNASVTIVKLSSVHEAGLLLPLVRSWHAESIYSHLPFSERKYLATVIKTLQRGPSGVAFYALYKGKAIALIDIAIGEAWLSEGGCYATCLAWFVAPTQRQTMLGSRIAYRLLSAANIWARHSGADGLFISGTHGQLNSLARIGNIMVVNISLNSDIVRARLKCKI